MHLAELGTRCRAGLVIIVSQSRAERSGEEQCERYRKFHDDLPGSVRASITLSKT